MKKLVVFIPIFIFSLITNSSYAQGVAVNTDGSTADPSALLDVKGAGKGVLVPRMTQSDRNLISSPANGLLIYQTDNTPGFYYNGGTPASPSWTTLKGAQGVPGTGLTNGTGAGQIYLTGTSPFAPQSPQSVTGDITISSTAVTSYNNIVPNNKGGAGNVNGILSADGSGTVSAVSTTGSGNIVLSITPTLITPTLVTPSLGTPTTLVGTNISGTAANLTAGKVTTNANLTGDVTSVGNATTYNNVVPVAKGGTGTASPGLVAGTNVTVSGTWPNQTINATGGGASPVLPFTTIARNINNLTTVASLSGGGSQAPTEATNILTYVPLACTISKFYVSYSGTTNITVTLRVGTSLATMAATSLTCTTSSGACIASGSSIAVAAGDFIDIGVSGGTTTVATLYTALGSN